MYARVSDSMPVLETKKLCKFFDSVAALRDLDICLESGEVVGLVGDNGAGKSTLIRLIAGNFAPSSGEILLEGCRIGENSPQKARKLGIEVIYQDLALCSNLSAAANIFLGREISHGILGALNERQMEARAHELFAELKADIQPGDLVRRMSGGQRQAVAIARALLATAKLVMMDEPTASISVKQVAEVLGLIRHLSSKGVAVLLVSHRLPDIFAVCDRVIVMRQGSKMADKPIAELSMETVTGLITGAIKGA